MIRLIPSEWFELSSYHVYTEFLHCNVAMKNTLSESLLQLTMPDLWKRRICNRNKNMWLILV